MDTRIEIVVNREFEAADLFDLNMHNAPKRLSPFESNPSKTPKYAPHRRRLQRQDHEIELRRAFCLLSTGVSSSDTPLAFIISRPLKLPSNAIWASPASSSMTSNRRRYLLCTSQCSPSVFIQFSYRILIAP